MSFVRFLWFLCTLPWLSHGSTIKRSVEAADSLLNPLDRVNISMADCQEAVRHQQAAFRHNLEMMAEKPQEPCYQGNQEFSFYCPTPTTRGRWKCIRVSDLCNGVPDCPQAEDELPIHCMYFLANSNQYYRLRRVLIDHYEEFHLS